MRKLLAIICVCLMLLPTMSSFAFGETSDQTTSSVVEQANELILVATPEERQEILANLIIFMLLFDGEDSVLDAFEIIGIDSSAGKDADVSSVPIEPEADQESVATVEFPIIFEENGFEVYLTAWESCEFAGGDIGYEFSVTVYNNSGTDYEFGVKDLKVNGWNMHEDGTYSSIVRIGAGEKTREIWQVSGIVEKAGLTSLDEVEEISGRFFIGEGDGWGREIVSQNITITKSDIDEIECKD